MYISPIFVHSTVIIEKAAGAIMSNEFEYLSHDEDGDEEDIDLMEDTSDGEAMSDEEEIGNGKVPDSEDEEEDEKIDITPEKPKVTPKAKAKAKAKS